MPWAFNGTTAPTAVASGNLTFTEPAGAEEGDLFVVNISFRSTAAFTLPTDWQLVASQLTGGNTTANSTGSIGSALQAYIVRGSSAPDLTFLRTGGDVAIGRLVSYRGNKIAGVHDTGVAETLGAASTTVTAASLTTAQIEELLVAGGAMARNTTASAFDAATQPATASGGTDTTTAPASNTWTERGDAGTTTGADAALAVADAIKATAAATGTLQYTAAASARHSLVVGAYLKETQYPDFRSSTSLTSSGINEENVVLTPGAMPSGWQPGDVFVMVMVNPWFAAGAPNDPTGWTQIGSDTNVNGGTGRASCYYKIAESGDTVSNLASFFAACLSSDEAQAHVLCFKDASGVEGAGSAADGSSNTTATGRSVVTSGLYRLAVNILAVAGSAALFVPDSQTAGWKTVDERGGASTDSWALVRPKYTAATISAPSGGISSSFTSAAFSFALKPRVAAPPPFRNPMAHMLVR